MYNKYIPSVIFEQDIEKSVQNFVSFFYKAPVFMQEIIRIHPKLTSVAEKERVRGELILKEFVYKYFKDHHDIINDFMFTVENDFKKKGKDALVSLTEIMEYQWSEYIQKFVVIPSIRGGTSFNPKMNFLYLSIFTPTDKERARAGMTGSAIIVHEICHLIFRDIVVQSSIAIESGDIMHLAQEVIAPIVMNQSAIKSRLELHDYEGNLYLKPIIFRTEQGDINMVDYVSNLYTEMNKKGKTFKEFVSRLIEIFTSIQSELEQKMNIWNTQGIKIFKDPTIAGKYSEPIVLKD